MSDLPSYVWALVLTGVVGIPAVTLAVLYRGAVAAAMGRRSATAVVVTGGAVWAGWVLTSALVSAGIGPDQESGTVNVWIPVAFAVALAAALLATRLPAVARILADPGTPARLAWPQTLRVVGAAFLIVLALGKLPAVFALPAGLGDIAVGVTAPFVARRLAAGARPSGALWFNIMGIVDLVVAVGIGFLAGLGPSPLLDVTPSTQIVAAAPLVLIPTTAVPLAFALHVVSLARLRAAMRPVTARRPVPAAG